ncbi:MAG: hypothetical protein LBS69_01155, partial [Prevotellaceae bacterium]|nr:hypothetical protein [Prevotellaceae bacterium]
MIDDFIRHCERSVMSVRHCERSEATEFTRSTELIQKQKYLLYKHFCLHAGEQKLNSEARRAWRSYVNFTYFFLQKKIAQPVRTAEYL